MLKFGLQNMKFRRSTFFCYALVSVFTVSSRLIQSDSSYSNLLICLFASILITVITLLMLWLICLLNQKYELGKQNISYPFGLIALVGAIRGFILHEIIAGFGLAGNVNLIPAILLSMFTTQIYFTVISSFIELALHQKDKFNQIFTEATLLLTNPRSVINEQIDPKLLYLTTLAGIKKSLISVGLGKDKSQSAALLAASKVIQSQINEVLRPLSHRLWVNGMGQVKHRDVPGILKSAIEYLDFDINLILVYQIGIGGYGVFLVLGFKTSLFVTTIGVLISALLMQGYFYLQRRVRKNLFQLGLTYLLLQGLLPVFVPLAIRNPLDATANAISGLLISPTLPGLILLISAYRLITRDNEIAIGAATSVRYRIGALSSEDQSSKSGIELAEYLHNSLQSELFGIAKRFEAASHESLDTDHSAVLNSLDSALNRSYEDISDNNLGSALRIQKLISSWQGIAEISIIGLDHLKDGSSLANRTGQIVEEMITNTIRYGEAKSIQIKLVKDSKFLLIELAHNGKGEITKKAGLGTLLLSQQSVGGIKISSEDGKTYVQINLPVGSVTKN